MLTFLSHPHSTKPSFPPHSPPPFNSPGTPLIFTDHARSLALHRHVGLAELQRHRRTFVKSNSYMPPASAAAGATFIDFLAMHL
jgi:hypothetical protein